LVLLVDELLVDELPGVELLPVDELVVELGPDDPQAETRVMAAMIGTRPRNLRFTVIANLLTRGRLTAGR
jgi:hypothetical protein